MLALFAGLFIFGFVRHPPSWGFLIPSIFRIGFPLSLDDALTIQETTFFVCLVALWVLIMRLGWMRLGMAPGWSNWFLLFPILPGACQHLVSACTHSRAVVGLVLTLASLLVLCWRWSHAVLVLALAWQLCFSPLQIMVGR